MSNRRISPELIALVSMKRQEWMGEMKLFLDQTALERESKLLRELIRWMIFLYDDLEYDGKLFWRNPLQKSRAYIISFLKTGVSRPYDEWGSEEGQSYKFFMLLKDAYNDFATEWNRQERARPAA